jgi:hypothetical protein
MALPDKELNKLTNCDLSEWSCDKCKLRTSTNNEKDSVREEFVKTCMIISEQRVKIADINCVE